MEIDPATLITTGMLQNFIDRLEFLEAQVLELTKINDSQNATIQALMAKPTPLLSQKDLEPVIADPEPFNGDRLKLQNFLSKCRLKFAAQPSRC